MLCDSFLVKLIVVDIHGCNDTTEKYITVWCLPQRSFTANLVCEGDTTTVESTSVAGNEPSAPIISWDWSFTNNTSSIVNHLFIPCNNYIEELIVTDANGCKDTTQGTITVYCNPNASYNVNDECYDNEQQPIEFYDASNNGSAPINYWQWTISGGNYVFPYNQDSANTQFHFNSCGLKNFSLYVRDANNCEDSISGSVNVWCEPIASFNLAPVCLNDTTVSRSHQVIV